MNEKVLVIKNINKSYNRTKILSDVSFSISKGEICGLVGNNGAGKTSIMRIICGQSKQDSGNIELFGKKDEREIQKERNRVGALIESPSFFMNFTARQNLEYFRLQFGIPEKNKVEEVLKTVGLVNIEKRRYKEFSLGMKQRLGIALSIMVSPELLILDEPINGLDPTGIIDIRNLLLKINKDYNTTILISSHILAELSNLATKYVFINKGKIIEEISTNILLQKCNEYIDIEVNDEHKMSVILEDEFKINDYRVYPNKHIHIYSDLDKVSVINKEAIKSNIDVISIRRSNLSLENYYLNLLGGSEND